MSNRVENVCRAFTVTMLCLGATVSAAAEKDNVLRHPELFHRLSTNVVTPHIRRARPLHSGRLKALVIGYRWQQRETVELMQRLDITCTPVLVYAPDALYSTSSHWGHEKTSSIKKDAVLRDFREKLQADVDVILLSRAAPADWPSDITASLIEKIRAGTGLVWFRPGDHPTHLLEALGVRAPPPPSPELGLPDERHASFLEDVPLEDPVAATAARLAPLVTGVPFCFLPGSGIRKPEHDLAERLSIHTCGAGRAVLVRYPAGGSLLTPACENMLAYETAMSFLVKAILWAAGVENELRLEHFPTQLSERDSRLHFDCVNSGRERSCALKLEVRSPEPFHRLPAEPNAAHGIRNAAKSLTPVFISSRELRMPNGRTTVSFDLPQLPDGEYLADVCITPSDGNRTWGSVHLLRRSPCRLSSITCTPRHLDLHTPGHRAVSALVTLSDPAPPGTVLHLSILDSYDRLLAEHAVTLMPGWTEGSVDLSLRDVLSTLLHVRAELRSGQRVLDVKTTELTAYNRPWDAFTFFAWGGCGRTTIDRHRFRLMAELGIDAVRSSIGIETLKVADIRQVRDICRLAGTADRDTGEVSPCFSSPEFQDTLRTTALKAVEQRPITDCFGYMFGDEFGYALRGGLAAACCSPSCTAHLRNFLKERYGTLEALNRQWNTAFQSFDEVTPNRSREPLLERGRETGNFSALIDQWLSNYRVFTEALALCRNTIKQADPNARVGPSTPLWNWYYRAYDWWATMRFCDFATPYGPWGDASNFESIRSFASPNAVLSAHYGSYVTPELHDEDAFRMRPYAVLFKGGANVFWYTTWGNEGGISPWLDPYPCLARTSESIRDIRRGIGALLSGAERQHSGIAIHYSTPSILFSFLVSGPHVPWRINALTGMLHGLGFQPLLLSREQILHGELDRFRVLFLPLSQCVGPEEGERIARFVRGGGLLIADVRPGIADAHGRLYRKSVFSDLFGLHWNVLNHHANSAHAFSPLQEAETVLSGRYRNQVFTQQAPSKLSVDPGTTVHGATVHLQQDGVPLITMYPGGDGFAVCLNTLFDGHPHLLKTMLSAHGIEPPLAVANTPNDGVSPGGWLPGFEAVRFKDDRAVYLGLTRRRRPGNGTLTVPIDNDAHVYDVLGNNYLGQPAALSFELPPSGVRLLACLPYRARSLDVNLASSTVVRGGSVSGSVRLHAGGDTRLRHVVHLETIRPDGRPARYGAANLELRAGAADFTVPVCFNETPGTWQLLFTDAATDVETSAAVEVLP